MGGKFKFWVSLSLAIFVTFPLFAQEEREKDKNPVVHLSDRDGAVQWMIEITQPLKIFRTRDAKQVRTTLFPNQKVTVLEMDKFGFHVRGEAKNGPVSGWTGWESLLGNAPGKHEVMEQFRQRQQKLLKLVEEKRPATGMSFEELKLTLGTPTKTDVSIVEGKTVRSVEWLKKKKVDSESILGPLAILTNEKELEIDTGSITAELVDDVVTAVAINLENGDNEAAELERPIAVPFSKVVFETQESEK